VLGRGPGARRRGEFSIPAFNRFGQTRIYQLSLEPVPGPPIDGGVLLGVLLDETAGAGTGKNRSTSRHLLNQKENPHLPKSITWASTWIPQNVCESRSQKGARLRCRR